MTRPAKCVRLGLRSSLAFILVLFALSAHADKNKGGPTVVRREGAHVTTLDATIIPAKQKCANWAWAAALETVLHARHIDLGQTYWIDRVYGGRCEDNVPTLEETARLIPGEYQDSNGAKYRLEANFTVGPPVAIDGILLSLMTDSPMILYYKSRPYLLTGIVYDEAWYPTGSKLFDVKVLELRDPLTSEELKFTKGEDNLDDIGGLLSLRVIRD